LGTALQESKLENLPGGDRDSVGLFQQRPSMGWGAAAQLQNPRYSAAKFYESLVKVRGWEGMRLTEAAQAVQRSGHPEAYQKWEQAAVTLSAALSGRAPAGVGCRLSREKTGSSVATAQTLTNEAAADLAPLALAREDTQRFTMAIPPTNPSRRGWQAAHWFVSKASEYRIRRVTYEGKTWSPESDTWSTARETSPVISIELG
jgi:hypothetical protein